MTTHAAKPTDAEQTADTAAPGAASAPPRLDEVLLDRTDPDFLAGAYQTYAQIRAAGPVVRVRHCPFLRDDDAQTQAQRGEQPLREILFVSRYEQVAEALVDSRLSSDPFVLLPSEVRAKLPTPPEPFRLFSRSLIMCDPPDHSRLRKLVQPSFSAKALDALRPRIQRLTDQLLDQAEHQAAERGELAPERRMDLIQAFAYPLPVAVISDLLGIPDEDREVVRRWSAFRMDSRSPAVIAETTRQFEQFSAYLRGLFARKRQAPADDMISQMIHAQEDGDRLSEDELLSMIFLLYLAGHVTTVNLIGNGVFALLDHPEQLARLRAEPQLVHGLVEETLRYYAPIDYFGSPRVATCDLDLGGVAIPKGAPVAVGLAAANRDPQRFAEPDRFDIARPDAHRHLAFGRGIHLCLGAPLARIEGEIAFSTLIRRLPGLRLAVPADRIRWTGASGTRGLRELPVCF